MLRQPELTPSRNSSNLIRERLICIFSNDGFKLRLDPNWHCVVQSQHLRTVIALPALFTVSSSILVTLPVFIVIQDIYVR